MEADFDCEGLLACLGQEKVGRGEREVRYLPRSNGWVTQAAMLLALPPNQKG